MRLFGHPVHPIAVTLPLAFLGAVPACDLLAWSGLLADGWLLGHYSIIVGLLVGAVALASGLSDLLTIEDPDAELSRNALTHAALAVSALVVFVTAFLLRPEAGAPVSTGVLVLEAPGLRARRGGAPLTHGERARAPERSDRKGGGTHAVTRHAE